MHWVYLIYLKEVMVVVVILIPFLFLLLLFFFSRHAINQISKTANSENISSEEVPGLLDLSPTQQRDSTIVTYSQADHGDHSTDTPEVVLREKTSPVKKVNDSILLHYFTLSQAHICSY